VDAVAFWVFVLNGGISAAISLGYARSIELSTMDWAYLAFVWLAHFGLLYLLAGLLLRAFGRMVGSAGWRAAAAVAVLSAGQVALVVDMKIYQLYRYHWNAWVMNVVLAGLGDSVQLGAGVVLGALGAAAGVLAVQAGLFWGAARVVPLLPAPLRAPRPGRVALAVLLLALAEKSVYAVRDLAGDRGQVRFVRLIPLHRGVTVKKFAERWFRYSPARGEGRLAHGGGATMLNYPRLESLDCGPAPRVLPNILVIAVEGWRGDMLGPEVTPFLWRFRSRCVVFRDHYSGGNASRFGIMALLYGLPGTYWDAFLAEERGPVVVDRLKACGYVIRVVSSTRFTFPEFRRTGFVEVRDRVDDELPAEGAVARDALHPAKIMALADEARRARKPFFAFMFLDAPHAPYHYPPDGEFFRPAAAGVNFATLGPSTDPVPIRNRYRNAVRYDDRIIGEVVAGLERRGILDRTAIFICGDHGEEFRESGFWGHTSAFTDQQVRTPMLCRFPGAAPREVRVLSSHTDVPPTIMELTGCRAPADSYSTGMSLLHPRKRDWIFVAGFNNGALVSDKSIVVVPTAAFFPSDIEERDHSYRLVAGGRAAFQRHRDALTTLMRDTSRFSR
jgi:hypothetical protein